jgi:hypothetical protein
MKTFSLDRSAERGPVERKLAALGEDDSVRPEVVSRGRDLAADSTYPPFEICTEIAQNVLESGE